MNNHVKHVHQIALHQLTQAFSVFLLSISLAETYEISVTYLYHSIFQSDCKTEWIDGKYRQIQPTSLRGKGKQKVSLKNTKNGNKMWSNHCNSGIRVNKLNGNSDPFWKQITPDKRANKTKLKSSGFGYYFTDENQPVTNPSMPVN